MVKRQAIICDLDDTITSSKWREHLYLEDRRAWGAGIPFDKPNIYLQHSLVTLSYFKVHIIYLTGRSEEFRMQTICWLEKYGMPDGYLCMRRFGDQSKNSEFKKEYYEKYIRSDDLEILFAIDDNPHVIEMWKLLSIPVIFIQQKNMLIPKIFGDNIDR